MPLYEETAAGLLVNAANNKLQTRESEYREMLMRESYLEVQNQHLQERLSQIELDLMSEDWVRFDDEESRLISREGLDAMVRLSRLMYRANPLINKGVSDIANYVFGQGVAVGANHPLLNDIIQEMWDDRHNRAELTSSRAQRLKDMELTVAGSVFLVLFTNPKGRVKVRSVPVEQIREVRANPEDWRDPWFYKRVWTQTVQEPGGIPKTEQRTAWYPDWQYQVAPNARPRYMDAQQREPILWDQPIYFVADGNLSWDRFGIPSCYSGLAWARAVVRELEAVATVHQALMHYTLKLRVPSGTNAQGQSHVQEATLRQRSTINAPNGTRETNPPGPAGQTFVHTEGVELGTMQTRGMAPDPEDGRRFWLMAQAGIGTPYSFVDPDQGNHATAKTLDRPTELMMVMRQLIWRDVIQDICQYQIDQAALHGMKGLVGEEREDDAGEATVVVFDPESGEPIDRAVAVSFPSLLERDVSVLVDAIVKASTMDGKPFAGTLSVKLATQMLLEALGVSNIDEVIATLFPEDDEPDDEEPEEAGLTETMQNLITVIRERTNGVAHAARP